MTFAPVIPTGGLSGWLYLKSTYDAQLEVFAKSPRLERDLDYFRENVASVRTAADLVSDRRFRKIALGAFGLQDDMNNLYFVQRLLEDGTSDDGALANRLADDRYRKFSQAFGLGPGAVRTTNDTAAMAEIADLYLFQSFEQEVGAQDDAMRTALYARRELANLAGETSSDQTLWLSILGRPPLRTFFQTALALPAQFGQVDLDRQVAVYQDRTRALLGSSDVSQFSSADRLDRLILTYQARAQIAASTLSSSSSATALLLLQSAQSG